jgi:hypothetical protein
MIFNEDEKALNILTGCILPFDQLILKFKFEFAVNNFSEYKILLDLDSFPHLINLPGECIERNSSSIHNVLMLIRTNNPDQKLHHALTPLLKPATDKLHLINPPKLNQIPKKPHQLIPNLLVLEF